MPDSKLPASKRYITRTKQPHQIVCPTCSPGKKGTRKLVENECTINRQVYGNCQWIDCHGFPRIDVDPRNYRWVARGRGKPAEKFPWDDGVQTVIPGLEGKGIP